MLLELKDITLLYGRIQALHGISLTVGQGEIVALIGANGAGKSTTMRAISGLRPVAQGSIRFDGEDITRLRADLRVVRGVSQSPEGRGIFPGMTVRENLEMGAYTRKNRTETNEDMDRARSEEHTSELQSRQYLVCRLLLEKKQQSYVDRVPP